MTEFRGEYVEGEFSADYVPPTPDPVDEHIRADQEALGGVERRPPAKAQEPGIEHIPGQAPPRKEVAMGAWASVSEEPSEIKPEPPLQFVRVPDYFDAEEPRIVDNNRGNGHRPEPDNGSEQDPTGQESASESEPEAAPDAGGDSGGDDQNPPADTPSADDGHDPDRPRRWLEEEPDYVKNLGRLNENPEPVLDFEQREAMDNFVTSSVKHSWFSDETLSSTKRGVRVMSKRTEDDEGQTVMTVKSIKVWQPIRGMGVGSTFLKEVINDYVTQDITAVKGEVSQIEEARTVFRALGANNIEFTTTDPSGEKITVPLTPQQALASINRATEQDGDSTLGMHVDLRAQQNELWAERAAYQTIMTPGERAAAEEAAFEAFTTPVNRCRDLVRSGANLHSDTSYQGTEWGDVPVDTFRIYPEPGGKPRPADAINLHSGFIARIPRQPTSGPSVAVWEAAVEEKNRALALELVQQMNPALQRNVEGMVSREPLGLVEQDEGKIPAVISTNPSGVPLGEVVLLGGTMPINMENVPGALEELRATVVDMAKHGIAPAPDPNNHVRWNGHRFTFTHPVLINGGIATENLREITERHLETVMERVFFFVGPHGNSLFRQTAQAWSQIKRSFNNYWQES